jgi:short-chain fatty acids transporter
MTDSDVNSKINNKVKLPQNTASGWQEKFGKFIPNPGTTVFLLTMILILVSILSGKHFEETMQAWGQGFISLYPFCMETILLFLAGYALAVTPLFKKIVRPLADMPKTSAMAALYLAVFSIALGFLNWGLGIVGGILLARETAKRLQEKGKIVSYPMLITSGCAGIVVWETGLSGIVPLYLAENAHFLSETFGVISLNQTVLSSANIITSLILLVAVPIVCYLVHPKKGNPLTAEQLAAEGLETKSVKSAPAKTPAERLENSTILIMITGVVALLSVFMVFSGGGTLDLKNYLFIILMLGISLRKRPMDYPADFNNGSTFVWFAAPVLVMFAALQGVINIDGGLGTVISTWMANIASSGTYPVVTFVISAISNILVPVTGSQWMMEGSFILNGAQAAGASVPASAMAFSYGAAWAKLIQVFFVLTWFGVMEVRVREVTKYFSILAVVSFVIFVGSLLILW